MASQEFTTEAAAMLADVASTLQALKAKAETYLTPNNVASVETLVNDKVAAAESRINAALSALEAKINGAVTAIEYAQTKA